MSGRGRRGNRNRNPWLSLPSREVAVSLAADSPVLAMFTSVARKLNARHDRHERLIKHSRDLTIESKRIIFLLHSALTIEGTHKVMIEAKERLDKLLKGSIAAIGLELEDAPAYLHSNAVTAGFQEFIEARTLYSLMENKTIISYLDAQREFVNVIKDDSEDAVERTVVTMLPYSDYMLGIADLTGELMRRAINNIASGDNEECFYLCEILKNLYTGFQGLYGTSKEFTRKLSTTRNNLLKVETAVYALCLRGNEAVPKMLLPSRPKWPQDPPPEQRIEDEGFFN